ncbi:hypothetical protein C8R43DRAFT_1035043 [Mycena crocata]|nr:hypothetical protein C8R43DRAFT_1035043 [Mycena crocata]
MPELDPPLALPTCLQVPESFMSGTVSCPGLPDELWHSIIDYFSTGSFGWQYEPLWPRVIPDLKACSLVSRAFRYPAQSLLFRHIQLTDVGLTICCALKRILEEAPHLGAHILSLAIPLDPEIMSLVIEMRLPRLRDVAIHGPRGRIDDSQLSLLQAVLSQDSIHHAHLIRFCSISRHLFFGMFAKCSPNLQGIHFQHCSALREPSVDSPSVPSRITTLTHLTAQFSHTIAKRLVYHGSPFDLSQITYVEIWGTECEEGTRILERARETLKRIHYLTAFRFPASSDVLTLNIHQFPGITHLELGIPQLAHITHFLSPLASLPAPHAVEYIVLVLVDASPDMAWEDVDEQQMHQFDAWFAALRFPALRMVEMRCLVSAKIGDAECDDEVPDADTTQGRMSAESFPVLNSKGMVLFSAYV